MLRIGLRSARRTVGRAGVSSLTVVDYDDERAFARRWTAAPSERYGNDYALNHSLATDGVAVGMSDAFRNAPVEHLLSYAHPERANRGSRVTKSRGLVFGGVSGSSGSFATDEVSGGAVARLCGVGGVVDVDGFEEAAEVVKQGFFTKKRTFVEDGVVGSHRDAEVRVRVVSDWAEDALSFRHLLCPTPLYDPDFFPRNILVVVDREGTSRAAAGWADMTGGDSEGEKGWVASDVNLSEPGSRKATVLAVGAVSIDQIAGHIALCAARLLAAADDSWKTESGASRNQRAVMQDPTRGPGAAPADFHHIPTTPPPAATLFPGSITFPASPEKPPLLTIDLDGPTTLSSSSSSSTTTTSSSSPFFVWNEKNHLFRFFDTAPLAAPKGKKATDSIPPGAVLTPSSLLPPAPQLPLALHPHAKPIVALKGKGAAKLAKAGPQAIAERIAAQADESTVAQIQARLELAQEIKAQK